MSGVNLSGRVQHEKPRPDAVNEDPQVGERPPGSSGTTVEQGVAGEHHAESRHVDAAPARRMAWGMEDGQFVPGHTNRQAVLERVIDPTVGVHHVPQHPVVGVQPDRGVNRVGQLHSGVDVVVVTVGAQHPESPTTGYRFGDRLVVMGSVYYHHLGVVAHQPDVVVDLEVLAVQREDPTGHHPLDPKPHLAAPTARPRSARPRHVPWRGRPPRPRRGQWSRKQTGPDPAGPVGTGR